jgi:ribonuclease VapC
LIAVDSSALVAIVLEEPESQRLMLALAQEDAVLLTTATWLETLMVVTVRASQRIPSLQALMEVVPHQYVAVDRELTEVAYAAFLKFGTGRHPAALNFGDCFSYALAKSRNLPLLFKGQDFSKSDLLSVHY